MDPAKLPIEVRDLVPAFFDFWTNPDRPWDAYIEAYPEVLNDLARSGRELDVQRRAKALTGYGGRDALIRSNATLARGWVENAASRVSALLGVADADLRAVTMVGVCTSNGWVDRGTLYLALEMIPDPDFGEVLSAHEIAHVLQARLSEQRWPDEGPLGAQIYSEGFATAVTAQLYPQHGLADHLWFQRGHEGWLTACDNRAEEAEKSILANLGSEDDAVIGSYLTLGAQTALPARIGYFIGTRIVQNLRREYSWPAMAHWSADRAIDEIATELRSDLESFAL
jgi:uncharacterized protein YjaZ